MTNLSVLVIGGSGFVGKALVPTLLAAGHAVTVLNRGNSPVAGVRQICADRNDPGQMQAHARAYDAVIDTSCLNRDQAEIAYGAFGTSGRWIYLSSASVYRDPARALPKETDPLGGAEVWGAYGADKSAADEFLAQRARMPIAILRPPYLYGPHNNVDRETFVWSRVLTQRPIVVPGDGTEQMQFLHIADLAEIMCHFASADFGPRAVFNVAHPDTMNAETWVRETAAAVGQTPKILLGRDVAPDVPARDVFPFRDVNCALDVSAFVAQTGWTFRYDFREGIRQTAAQYVRADLMALSPTKTGEAQVLERIAYA